uniref:Uncharacterized protein n=1 Tax=Kalanchoe fedtschenkoi TaxID=63787 RepID=A0A7N0URQ1_KALFE
MEAKSDSVEDRVFGAAPSESEAESALTQLHNFSTGISSPGTYLDRFQRTLLSYYPAIVQSAGFQTLTKALSFLQTDLSFQRVVVSLTCDKALWNAVMSNKEVVEMKRRLLPDLSMPQSCMDEQDLAHRILKWILELTKRKITELIESFRLLVNAVFQNYQGGDLLKPNEQLEEKIASSVLLCIVNLLIIILARAQLICS